MSKQTIVSGVAPSGNVQIGNYLGAIKQWATMQNDYDCIFFIVDLHAITTKKDPAVLREKTREVTKIYLACGIDPEKSNVFIQSHVPAHAELTWILSSITKVAELERMTQFKDKSAKHASNINAALMNYPILMAADILLYNTNLVPVGEDQKQHVELTRTLGERFNKEYGETFVIPEAYIPKAGARIMSLLDPARKMDKSDPNAGNYIALRDKPAIIMKKIKRAVTDSGSEVKADASRPALTNLLTIYSLIADVKISDLEKKYQGKGYAEFKNDLGETIIRFFDPIQKKLEQLDNDEKYLDKILAAGAKKADAIANETLNRVKEKIGLK